MEKDATKPQSPEAIVKTANDEVRPTSQHNHRKFSHESCPALVTSADASSPSEHRADHQCHADGRGVQDAQGTAGCFGHDAHTASCFNASSATRQPAAGELTDPTARVRKCVSEDRHSGVNR